MVKPSIEHEKFLDIYIEELRAEGYNVIKMGRKIPDAVATKDGKLFAVEMMDKPARSGLGWVNPHTLKEKQINYSKFDGLLYREFRYAKKD